MSDKKPVLTGLLDDMLDPETVAKLKEKRSTKARTDLSDLITERPKPIPLELLNPTSVIFYAQTNTCACGSTATIPLGLAAMHPFKRNGRIAEGRIGVPLQEPNDYPHIPRERDIQHSQSRVCADCVDQARLVPRTKPADSYSAPRPNTPQWLEQFGYASPEEIHAYAERLQRADERLRREIEGSEASLDLVPLVELVQRVKMEEEVELTNPEDVE